MDEQLKQLGERLRGLRDVLDIPASEVADIIGVTPDNTRRLKLVRWTLPSRI